MTTKPDDTPAPVDVPAAGTPEYEEIYQNALKELEAQDAAAAKPPDESGKVAAPAAGDKTPEQIAAEAAAKAPEIPKEVQDRIDVLQEQLDTSNARQTETRNWASGIVKRLREFQTNARAPDADRPALLDDLDGLQESVEHIIKGQGIVPGTVDDGLDFPGDESAVQEYTPEQWLGIVHTAMPDMDELMKDDGLLKQVEAAKAKMGENWLNPLLAIQAMSDLRSNHLHQHRLGEAVKVAIAEYARTHARAGDMILDGGGTGGGDMEGAGARATGENPEVNDAAHWSSKNMSDDEFEKKRQGVLSS